MDTYDMYDLCQYMTYIPYMTYMSRERRYPGVNSVSHTETPSVLGWVQPKNVHLVQQSK